MKKASERILKVIVKPGSSKSCIEGFDKNRDACIVCIKEQAKEGKANLALIKLLSKEFKTDVKIINGAKSKVKILKIASG